MIVITRVTKRIDLQIFISIQVLMFNVYENYKLHIISEL
jgi:hypothetical protein